MGKINKISKTIDFIEYISKNMEKDDLMLLYKINNIIIDDVTIGEEKNNHFKWCWSKVISSFKEERIYFIDVTELFNYFKEFYKESFYYEEDKDIDSIKKITEFWGQLFDFSKGKTMSEYETLLELYKIFNKSFVVN